MFSPPGTSLLPHLTSGSSSSSSLSVSLLPPVSLSAHSLNRIRHVSSGNAPVRTPFLWARFGLPEFFTGLCPPHGGARHPVSVSSHAGLRTCGIIFFKKAPAETCSPASRRSSAGFYSPVRPVSVLDHSLQWQGWGWGFHAKPRSEKREFKIYC